MQISMHTCERVQRRGPGNGTGRQKSPGDAAGGMCTGVQNWHLCMSGLGVAMAVYTAHAPPFSSLLFWIPVGAPV